MKGGVAQVTMIFHAKNDEGVIKGCSPPVHSFDIRAISEILGGLPPFLKGGKVCVFKVSEANVLLFLIIYVTIYGRFLGVRGGLRLTLPRVSSFQNLKNRVKKKTLFSRFS